MVFTVREAYGGVSGRLLEAIFSRLRLQTLSGGVPGSILADFKRFWVPFGSLFGLIWMKKRIPESTSKKTLKLLSKAAGAGGRGGVL